MDYVQWLTSRSQLVWSCGLFFLGFEGDKRGWGERKTRRNVERDEENEWRGAVTGSHTYTGELACALPSGETGEPHSRTRNKLIINRFKANFDSCLFDIFTAVFVRKNFHLPSRVAVGLLGCFFYLLHFPTIVRFRLAAVRHTLTTTAGMQSYTPLCQSIFSTSVMNPQRALSFSDIDCGSCYPVAVCFFTFARTGEPRAVKYGGNTGRERAERFSDFPTPPTTRGDTTRTYPDRFREALVCFTHRFHYLFTEAHTHTVFT